MDHSRVGANWFSVAVTAQWNTNCLHFIPFGCYVTFLWLYRWNRL